MFLDDRCQVDVSLISSTIDSEHPESARNNLLTGYLIVWGWVVRVLTFVRYIRFQIVYDIQGIVNDSSRHFRCYLGLAFLVDCVCFACHGLCHCVLAGTIALGFAGAKIESTGAMTCALRCAWPRLELNLGRPFVFCCCCCCCCCCFLSVFPFRVLSSCFLFVFPPCVFSLCFLSIICLWSRLAGQLLFTKSCCWFTACLFCGQLIRCYI